MQYLFNRNCFIESQARKNIHNSLYLNDKIFIDTQSILKDKSLVWLEFP